MTSLGLRRVSLLLASALLLAGCGSGGDEEEAAPGGTAEEAPSSESTASGSAEPEEDGLTPPGSELELKQSATFTWQPKQKVEGTVEVRVDRLKRTTMADFAAFKLDKAMRRSIPYYVQVRVKNLTDENLGGVELPLFLDNGSDVLFPSARITSSFKPCPSRPLPKKFTKGKKADLCLVFLSPEKTELEAVALRPSEADEPITWTGKVAGSPDEKQEKQGKKGKKKDS
ncbi:hypothetical protein [Nocardioides donggukensis]|uniref:DUF4352 domain-containing protein n=1 Tax=Nocardioides donggukensis TaxID=2774019 RepID=A0A927K4Z2_9ACTN|nr:hypothetical protein [Nocardioides donggukensis]MBD8869976.1 hypothetical protein [Nocardioides donggukensis]